MKNFKKKRLRIEHINKRRIKKAIKRKKKFNNRVNEITKVFLKEDKGLIFSQAKQKAIKLMLS